MIRGQKQEDKFVYVYCEQTISDRFGGKYSFILVVP